MITDAQQRIKRPGLFVGALPQAPNSDDATHLCLYVKPKRIDAAAWTIDNAAAGDGDALTTHFRPAEIWPSCPLRNCIAWSQSALTAAVC
jgi:hypothetical protein